MSDQTPAQWKLSFPVFKVAPASRFPAVLCLVSDGLESKVRLSNCFPLGYLVGRLHSCLCKCMFECVCAYMCVSKVGEEIGSRNQVTSGRMWVSRRFMSIWYFK